MRRCSRDNGLLKDYANCLLSKGENVWPSVYVFVRVEEVMPCLEECAP